MEEVYGQLRLDRERRTAEVTEGESVIRLRSGDAKSLRGVETLLISAGVTAFFGLNRFPDLRTVRYDGSADIFGFRESLEWLAERPEDDEDFLRRLATDMLAAPPISGTLTAVVAPRMTPPHAMARWDRLLEAIDDLAACSNGRQDSSRQNVILCRSYAQWKRLEYAFYLGFGVSETPYPPETARCYKAEACFSPEEQAVYALALMQGHSYQAFYTADGPCGYTNLREKASYLTYLRKQLRWEDTEAFTRDLGRLLDAGLLTAGNVPAAVDLLTRARLPEATAFLLDQSARHWPRTGGARDSLDAEFEL